ncbi:hypothetical protein [Streptomyces canus]|uniref:hypothetical protein n=1 Tax=Streptomyces canus TaxID=58343 RepID=UPI00386A9777|nr:hypothetical protein OH824_24420 [Streptomyces canus]
MAAAVEEAGVGEVDGNEFGGGEVVLYAYGPDAQALFKGHGAVASQSAVQAGVRRVAAGEQ